MGKGTTIRIGEVELADPLAYFTDSKVDSQCPEPAAIDLALFVSKGVGDPGELQYWPKYADLTMQQRRYYLNWLAAGRTSPPAEIGYAFLFFYGLERRAIIDQTDQVLVFDEVLRLRRLYADADRAAIRSWEFYSLHLLWFLIVAFPKSMDLGRVRALTGEVTTWTDDYLSALQSWFSSTDTPLSDWAAYAIAEAMPESQRSVVLRRVGDEFRRLFYKRYADRFGRGMELQNSKRDRKYDYRAASAIFGSVSVTQVNPAGVRSQYKPLIAIWNDCIAELKKLSSVVGRSGADRLTVSTWEAMPPELRAGTDHPLTDKLCELIAQSESIGGYSAVSAMSLARTLEIGDGIRLTAGQSRRTCELAEQIGYCVEPDARLTGKAYRADEIVVLFLKAIDDEPDPGRYMAASCMLHVAMLAAAADGEVHEKELAVLAQGIDSAFMLNEHERRRLDALRALVAAHGADTSIISRVAKRLDASQREAIGKLVLSLVAADGVITAAERNAVRHCYLKLGFEKGEIDHVLTSLQGTTEDDPITVAAAGPAIPGHAIPPPPDAQQNGLRLNRAAIAAIMRDTREVSEMLAAAMASDDSAANGEADVAEQHSAAGAEAASTGALPKKDILTSMSGPAVVSTGDPTLPVRYAAFYQTLIAQGEWAIKEAEAAARSHGHMLSGAVEALNEWAVDRYGSQLFVEDGDRLLVEREILN